MEFQEVTTRNDEIEELLMRHAALMRSLSEEESCHVMTAQELRASGAQVFGLFDAGTAVAVGALKPLEDTPQALAGFPRVELKSMHVRQEQRGAQLGRKLLQALLAQAERDGAQSVWLETGSDESFAAARRLYEAAGFEYCPPFAGYLEDPASVFMTKTL